MTKKRNNRKAQSLIQLALFAGILLFINILGNARIGGNAMYAALDMTEEKRFTLTDPTERLLENLDDVVYVRVLLGGEFPAGFKRLQEATRDMLDDFRSVSGYVEYSFENPMDGTTDEVNERKKQLSKDGIQPINLRVKETEGTAEKLIYPFAIIYYKNRTQIVRLLENEVPGMPPEIILNNSVSLLEYKFSNAIQKLQLSRKPNILFTTGHGELAPIQTADLHKTLRDYYEIGRVNMDSVVAIGKEASVLIVAKPTRPFSEKDKFKLDQYVMNGGKVLWLIDRIRVDLDSLQGRKQYYPNDYNLNIDDLLFNYGVRIQPNLVLDIQSSTIPQVVGMNGNAPQFEFKRYPYHVVVTPKSTHPIVKGIGPINLLYPSTIDTSVIIKTGVKKTPLLESSRNTRMQYIPVKMDFEFLRLDLKPEKFNKAPQVLGLLLEGTFPSNYENKVTESMLSTLRDIGLEYKTLSEPSKMIVVSDGDVIRNNVSRGGTAFSPLGYNEFDKYLFANKDFVVNAIEYLMDDKGVIEARSKEVKLRLLDTVKAQKESGFWQFINIGLPLIFLAIFGVIYNWLRRRRYARV